MNVSEPVGDRGDVLGFARAVKAILGPVLAELGFSVVDASIWDMRFESDRVWAWVFHEDAASSAVGYRFGRLDDPDRINGFGVSDGMALVDPVAAAQQLDRQAETSAELREALEHLTREIQTYSVPALRGDAEVFAAMKHARELRSRRFSEWTYRAAEMGFSDALKRGDWARVVEVYESGEHELNSLEARKLQIAQQNVRTQSYCDPEWCDESVLGAELARAYDSYGHFDGTAEEREQVERAVGDAMDAGEWAQVIALYESASYDLEYLQRTRLEIARRQLG